MIYLAPIPDRHDVCQLTISKAKHVSCDTHRDIAACRSPPNLLLSTGPDFQGDSRGESPFPLKIMFFIHPISGDDPLETATVWKTCVLRDEGIFEDKT